MEINKEIKSSEYPLVCTGWDLYLDEIDFKERIKFLESFGE